MLAKPKQNSRGAHRRGAVRNGHTPDRVAEIQRIRILAAMAEVCAEHGAANVTVAHIVELAGVSRRTFYEQFTDRDDCFLTAFDDAVDRLAGYVLPAYTSQDSWRERIRAGLIGLLSFLEDEPYMGRLLVVETLGAGERALARRHDVLSHVLAALEEGRRERGGRVDLPQLTAEGVAGSVLAVLHARLLEESRASLIELAGQLMSMIALPYLGASAARRELARPMPVLELPAAPVPVPVNTLRDLGMRLTYRTVRVLSATAASPGASNRDLGIAADVTDQGQMSKLLTRLHKLGLIENVGTGHARGGPNAWMLTPKGAQIHSALVERPVTQS